MIKELTLLKQQNSFKVSNIRSILFFVDFILFIKNFLFINDLI